MIDLHLVGLPRTGSSWALYYFTGVLRHAGIQFVDLFEPSNPRLRFIPKDLGYKVAGFQTEDENTHDDCIRMYESFSHMHRLIKHCFTPPCVPLMEYMLQRPGIRWIEVRRDPFERYLSWAIAERTGVWVTTKQDRLDEAKQALEPFAAPIDDLLKELANARLYEQSKARMLGDAECIGVINYDTLHADCIELSKRVLPHYGAEIENACLTNLGLLDPNGDLLPRKSMTLEEKKHMVINWRELQQVIIEQLHKNA